MSSRGTLIHTGLPAGAVSAGRVTRLNTGWLLASTPPDEWRGPDDLEATGSWVAAPVPGTVAQAVGPADVDAHPHYDAFDWWYRCSFPAPRLESPTTRVRLRFDGLATLSEVWLNGESILRSNNMFQQHQVDVTEALGSENELIVVCRSLARAVTDRRPRPRWRTRLVRHQQLRWFRTTLLGRIPGWTPCVEPVGIWRPAWLETLDGLDVREASVQPLVRLGSAAVKIDATIASMSPATDIADTVLVVGEWEFPLRGARTGDAVRFAAEVAVPQARLWWPRTHGEPVLYPCALLLGTRSGSVRVDLGAVGFRDVRLDQADGRIRFLVNDVPVFCRGACWTNTDIVSLTGSEERTRRSLQLLVGANANMIRVGGTMVYETDAFYQACDELGLMVWQDFMFANMDYPVDDVDFRSGIEAEAEQQLRRLQRHASVVAYCGGSEVEQQAAMFGAPKVAWSNDFFESSLPAKVREFSGTSTPYWSSTPTGGALPFHVGEGLTHYYGLGAYRRPLDDVRLAQVKFTPECLGFSNVPEPENLSALTERGPEPPHHPAWKLGVPRDSGAGWDFEDIRDHYLGALLGIDPVELRSRDFEEYLALSRTITGRVMAHAFDEWRSPESGCGGALVWFAQDLRPGAGWGILDSDGRPKPAYYFLKRAWSTVRIRLLDRGLDGLVVEVENETEAPIEGTLHVRVIGSGSVCIAEGGAEVSAPPRGVVSFLADALLESFTDLTYSYRFGPPKHEAVLATLTDSDGERLDRAVYRPAIRSPSGPVPSVHASAHLVTDGLELAIGANAILDDVRIEVQGHLPSDNYLILEPDQERRIHLPALDAGGRFRGVLSGPGIPEAVAIAPPEADA